MAPLPDAARTQIWRGLMRYLSARRDPLGLTKAELRAAIDAADAWADANAASFNTALPQPARSALSAGQKALLLAIVALARTDPQLARVILGEVD